MVIYNTDSCNTLISLDRDYKTGDYNNSQPSPEQEYVPTKIILPADEFCYWDDEEEQQLYLPINSRVDEYLKGVPQLMDARDELLANTPVSFTKDSSEKVLYVAQGEVAHCTSSQCDVLVSDKATTCHIIALRSEQEGNEALSSLTHIDGTSYEDCIRDMVDEHIVHHQQSDEEEKKSEFSSSLINLDVHVIGGFEDAESTSLEISVWFMGLLARIAEENSLIMKMTLKGCAISCMNDSGHESPIARGLGIDTQSGHVFLAKVEEEAAGPEVTLRSVRLFSESERKSLSVIHSSKSDSMRILPFAFNSFAHIDRLLKLSDRVLLQHTSSSPHVEEPDFCSSIRTSLKYLLDEDCKQVFGPQVDKTLVYRRSGHSNQWSMAR